MTILTLKEASEFLKIKKSYLRQLVKQNKIPYRQCRNHCCITFSKEAITAWWMGDHKPLPLALRIKKQRLARRQHGTVSE